MMMPLTKLALGLKYFLAFWESLISKANVQLIFFPVLNCQKISVLIVLFSTFKEFFFFDLSLSSFSLIITNIFLVWERFEKINKSHMITFSFEVTSQIAYCNIEFSHLGEGGIIWTQILFNKDVIKPQLYVLLMRPSKLWGLHKSNSCKGHLDPTLII